MIGRGNLALFHSSSLPSSRPPNNVPLPFNLVPTINVRRLWSSKMMDMRINMIMIRTKKMMRTLHREGRPDSGDFYLKLMRLKAEQEEHLKLVSLDEKENACRKSPPCHHCHHARESHCQHDGYDRHSHNLRSRQSTWGRSPPGRVLVGAPVPSTGKGKITILSDHFRVFAVLDVSAIIFWYVAITQSMSYEVSSQGPVRAGVRHSLDQEREF